MCSKLSKCIPIFSSLDMRHLSDFAGIATARQSTKICGETIANFAFIFKTQINMNSWHQHSAFQAPYWSFLLGKVSPSPSLFYEWANITEIKPKLLASIIPGDKREGYFGVIALMLAWSRAIEYINWKTITTVTKFNWK